MYSARHIALHDITPQLNVATAHTTTDILNGVGALVEQVPTAEQTLPDEFMDMEKRRKRTAPKRSQEATEQNPTEKGRKRMKRSQESEEATEQNTITKTQQLDQLCDFPKDCHIRRRYKETFYPSGIVPLMPI